MQNLTLFSLITEIWRVFYENYPIFVDGLLGTLQLAAITVLFGTVLGAFIALAKTVPNKTVIAASCYYRFIRYRFRGFHRLS